MKKLLIASSALVFTASTAMADFCVRGTNMATNIHQVTCYMGGDKATFTKADLDAAGVDIFDAGEVYAHAGITLVPDHNAGASVRVSAGADNILGTADDVTTQVGNDGAF